METLVDVPGSDYNLKITKWQLQDMNRRGAVINRRRKKRLDQVKDLERTSRGTPLGYKIAEVGMGKAEELSLSPINVFTDKMTRTGLKQKHKSLRKHSKDEFFREKEMMLVDNYIRGLLYTYKQEDIQPVIDAILKMDFNEFYLRFMQEGGTFEFASDIPSDSDMEAYVDALKAQWIPSYRRKKGVAAKAKELKKNIEESKPKKRKKNDKSKIYTLKGGKQALKIVDDLDLERLKNTDPLTGTIHIYDENDKDVGHFKTGREAVRFINFNKIKDAKYRVT
jgi:hypothetical protein